MKWGLVAASLSDMSRPVEDVSIPQCSGMLQQLDTVEIIYSPPSERLQLTETFIIQPLSRFQTFSIGPDRNGVE